MGENFNMKIYISPQDEPPLPPLETIDPPDFGLRIGVRRPESQVPRTSYYVRRRIYFLQSTVYGVQWATYDVRRTTLDVVVEAQTNHNMLY